MIFLAAIPTAMWGLAYLADEGLADDQWMFGIPFLGLLYAKFFAPDTYFKMDIKMDTAQMFQESVRAAVLEAVDAITTAKGLRSLTELERKPILRGLQPR